MALLQISEPGMSHEPHKRNVAIGIDLGTTNSLVATIKSGVSTVLANHDGDELIPSIVCYKKDKTLIGKNALKERVNDATNTIVSVKRFIGRSFKDISSELTYPYKFTNKESIIEIETTQGTKNPIQVSSDILYHLNQIAVECIGEAPAGVVITVPAYFNEAQRQATKQAGQLAGLNVLRLLNEPTAAAIAYGLDTKNEGMFLVYDLGGGTLDVSILRLSKGVFEVFAVNGDTYLGGDDFDHRLYCYILEKSNLTQLTDGDTAQLLNMAKFVKEQLSTLEKVAFNLVLSNKRLVNMLITREEFNIISQTLINKAMLPVKKALRDAKLSITAIDEVILVGGSTRLLNIRHELSKMFERELLSNIDPDKVVAMGAAIQADVLIGNRKDEDWLLLDVTPLSLGVETMGGIVEKIIPRNSTIPISRAQEFTTYKDGQTAMSIHVVQGERELVSDCRSLAKFSLRGIPPMVAGAARVKVLYQIDADGLLSVEACEETSAIKSSIEVKPSFGLTDNEIADMLNASIQNAKEDMMMRQLMEATVDANALVESVQACLISDYDLLESQELESINNVIQELKSKIEGNEESIIKTKTVRDLTDKLNQITEKFANQRMDRAIHDGLAGRSITTL